VTVGQVVRFVAAGGTAAVVNFGSRIVLSHVMPYAAAIVVAYCIGMTTAFVLNRIFVFPGARNALHSQAAWFIVINLAAVLQTLAISLILVEWLFPMLGFTWHAETVAHGVGVLMPVFTSYIGHKRYSFKTGPS